jgi:formylglycine-generating enzyme required for sulfatase activity/serine/threonine protein kinase
MADGTSSRRTEDHPAGAARSQASPETVPGNHPATDLPEQLGRYRIKKRLGGGGMGAVYLVENTELQRDEALKVPHFERGSDPAVRERFLREARAAAKLDHPNLCPIYDVGVIDGIYFLTMRLLPGKPLSAYSQQPQPPSHALKTIAKLAQALEYAHGKGVIHRDLKPGNIMMCPSTGPTVLDFGLAKQTKQSDKKLTQTGMAMGTPAYMPPEQVKGDLDAIGPASDVYSLGVILFELLTGRLPFQGSATEVMANVILTEAPLPSQLRPGLNPALDAVCSKAMAKAPEQRYPSMKEFAAALAEIMQTLPAKGDTGVEVAARGGKNADDLFDVPTVAPEPPRVPKRPPENKRQPPSKTISEALPADEPKARKRSRKPQGGVALPRGSSPASLLVVWLGLSLLLGGVAVLGLLMLREKFYIKPTRSLPIDPVRLDLNLNIINEIGMKLVRIPPGKFKMGSPDGEAGRCDNEKQHPVEITQEFWLGVHEVTQKEFKDIMRYNPSYFSADGTRKPGEAYITQPAGGKDKVAGMDTSDLPVENVSWEEAKEFCTKLTERDKNRPAGWTYRLPTEAEWEYSCRGGAASSEPFHFGNSLSGKDANFNSDNPLNRTWKVGSYAANQFGLHDMHGNAWEWCSDWYDKDYYGKSVGAKDPPGPPEGSDRVFRGGSWRDYGSDCRSAYRGRREPAYRLNFLGFRVAGSRRDGEGRRGPAGGQR